MRKAMKPDLTRFITLAAAALAALSFAACQSASPGNSAVMCAKCKTTWVSSPVAVNPGSKPYLVYRDAKTMSCPECESAAATFFKSGSLKHHCSHCGDTLAHCERH